MVAEGRGLPSLPRSLLVLGIWVGKGWEGVLKYEIRGGEVGGRTRVRNLEMTWGTKRSHFGYQTSEP